MKKEAIQKLVFTALLMALGFVLPFLTGQIPQVGSMLLPLHLPVLLCGFVCGWSWGTALGFVLPIMRSLLFGAPPMIPTALCMAFEMAAYGAAAGVLYRLLPSHRFRVYAALIGAMAFGRVVWGVASWLVYGLLLNKPFGIAMFWMGGFVNAWPGMILQLVLVPLIVVALERTKVLSVKMA